MEILTLELLDVTVFQALLELRSLLAEHPGEAMCVRGEDELLRLNIVGFLEKQGRATRLVQEGLNWELWVAEATRPVSPVAEARPTPPARPILLLRSAFAPGDRALGRRLLLETLVQVAPGTPWVCLAHQAVELLEDHGAVAVLAELRERGVPVHISAASAAHGGHQVHGFDLVSDGGWQKLLVSGGVTVL